MDCSPLSTTTARWSVLVIVATVTFLFFQFKRGPFLTFSWTILERCLLNECCLWSMFIDLLSDIDICSYYWVFILCQKIIGGHGRARYYLYWLITEEGPILKQAGG